jgi:hypothetical protein
MVLEIIAWQGLASSGKAVALTCLEIKGWSAKMMIIRSKIESI